MGTICGGDGQTTFAETQAHSHGDPNAGGASNSTGGSLGDNYLQPETSMNWVIARFGTFPSQGGGVPDTEPFLGDIRLFAGSFAPGRVGSCPWPVAADQPVSALFAILGTTFGGDGQTTFSLPDLRGRIPVGVANGVPLGTTIGTEGLSILIPHDHAVSYNAPVPLPPSLPMLPAGLGLVGLRLRRR